MSKKARRNYIKATSNQIEHKKMYKAKSKWIVADISLLVAMGIGIGATHTNIHADTTNNSTTPTTNKINNHSGTQTPGSVKQQNNNSNKDLIKAHTNFQTNANVTPKSNTTINNNVQNQANNLHSHIIANNAHNANSINNSNNNRVNNLIQLKQQTSQQGNNANQLNNKNVAKPVNVNNQNNHQKITVPNVNLNNSNRGNKPQQKVMQINNAPFTGGESTISIPTNLPIGVGFYIQWQLNDNGSPIGTVKWEYAKTSKYEYGNVPPHNLIDGYTEVSDNAGDNNHHDSSNAPTGKGGKLIGSSDDPDGFYNTYLTQTQYPNYQGVINVTPIIPFTIKVIDTHSGRLITTLHENGGLGNAMQPSASAFLSDLRDTDVNTNGLKISEDGYNQYPLADNGTYTLPYSPKLKTDIIEYSYKGHIINTQPFTGISNSDIYDSKPFTITKNSPGIPQGYYLVNNRTLNYDGGTYQVDIRPRTYQEKIIYQDNTDNKQEHNFTGQQGSKEFTLADARILPQFQIPGEYVAVHINNYYAPGLKHDFHVINPELIEHQSVNGQLNNHIDYIPVARNTVNADVDYTSGNNRNVEKVNPETLYADTNYNVNDFKNSLGGVPAGYQIDSPSDMTNSWNTPPTVGGENWNVSLPIFDPSSLINRVASNSASASASASMAQSNADNLAGTDYSKASNGIVSLSNSTNGNNTSLNTKITNLSNSASGDKTSLNNNITNLSNHTQATVTSINNSLAGLSTSTNSNKNSLNTRVANLSTSTNTNNNSLNTRISKLSTSASSNTTSLSNEDTTLSNHINTNIVSLSSSASTAINNANNQNASWLNLENSKVDKNTTKLNNRINQLASSNSNDLQRATNNTLDITYGAIGRNNEQIKANNASANDKINQINQMIRGIELEAKNKANKNDVIRQLNHLASNFNLRFNYDEKVASAIEHNDKQDFVYVLSHITNSLANQEREDNQNLNSRIDNTNKQLKIDENNLIHDIGTKANGNAKAIYNDEKRMQRDENKISQNRYLTVGDFATLNKDLTTKANLIQTSYDIKQLWNALKSKVSQSEVLRDEHKLTEDEHKFATKNTQHGIVITPVDFNVNGQHVNSQTKLDQLPFGQVARFHGLKVARVQLIKGYNYFMVITPLLVHQQIYQVGSNQNVGKLTPNEHKTISIKNAFLVQGKRHNYVRFETNQNNFVTGNDNYVVNAYIQHVNRDQFIQSYRPCAEYSSRYYTPKTFLYRNQNGFLIPVKQVIHIGKKNHYRTRIVLMNNHYITANKNFVEVIK